MPRRAAQPLVASEPLARREVQRIAGLAIVSAGALISIGHLLHAVASA